MVKKARWGKKHKDTRDWKKYNEHLIKRGEFFVNLGFLLHWVNEVKTMNNRKVGKPFQYPQSLIEFLAMFKSKGYDYRSLEGIMRGLSKTYGPFPIISFSQIRRRILQLPLNFHAKYENMIAGIDGSGMKVSNRGEWIREKWKVKRGWVKITILGDIHGNIIDVIVGSEERDEREDARELLRKHGESISKVLMDGLHDCEDTFDTCAQNNIEPGIKIRKNASGKGFGVRAKEVKRYQRIGYENWSIEKGYGYRWPASEGIFSAVKRIFGEGILSHKTNAIFQEGKLKFWAYQRLKSLGR